MGNKTIFLDQPTEEILKKIKETNPNFNFSAYIQECLLKFGGSKMDESDILQKLGDIEVMKTKISSEEIFWRKRHEEFLINRALKEKAAKEEEEERIREIEHKEYMQKVQEFLIGFNKESPYWEEYQKGIQEGKWKGTVEYAKTKF